MQILARNILNIIPLNFIQRIAGINPIVVNYHIVSDKLVPHVKNIYKYKRIRNFKSDIEFLTRNFNPLDLKTLIESIKTGSPLPEKSFLITFDDGFSELYDNVAPIMTRYNVSPVIFLTKDFIDNFHLSYDCKKSLLVEKIHYCNDTLLLKEIRELLGLKTSRKKILFDSILKIKYRESLILDKISNILGLDFDEYLKSKKPYLSSKQITELINSNFSIGGHSIDHPDFSELTLNEQIRQSLESVDYLQSKFKINYRTFAFPYRDKNISFEFFGKINGLIDVSFGTSGFLKDVINNNIQRISFEKWSEKSSVLLKYYYLKYIAKRIIGNNTLVRY